MRAVDLRKLSSGSDEPGEILEIRIGIERLREIW